MRTSTECKVNFDSFIPLSGVRDAGGTAEEYLLTPLLLFLRQQLQRVGYTCWVYRDYTKCNDVCELTSSMHSKHWLSHRWIDGIKL